ncbi:MAG: contractile injection system tape measure protein [Odoribacter sp.]
MYLIFIRALSGKLTSREKERVSQAVMKRGYWFRFLEKCSGAFALCSGAFSFGEKKAFAFLRNEEELMLIEVRNAGLVLFAPWMIQLFGRLNLLQEDKKAFASVDEQVRSLYFAGIGRWNGNKGL